MNRNYNKIEKLTTIDVAKILHKSEEFIRYGLVTGALPFGVAIKLPKKKKYNYFINPKQFWEYVGNEKNIENIYMEEGIFIL